MKRKEETMETTGQQWDDCTYSAVVANGETTLILAFPCSRLAAADARIDALEAALRHLDEFQRDFEVKAHAQGRMPGNDYYSDLMMVIVNEARSLLPPSEHESVLIEAERLINGDRRAEYGDVVKSFEDVAAGWSLIIGAEVTAIEVALCMTWLKTMREVNKHKRENIVDLAGYVGLAAQIADFLDSQQEG